MELCRAAVAASGSCEKSRPGLSMRRRFLSSTTSWAVRVTPGRLPTWTALALLRLLIKEDLPTFGSPTMPAAAPPKSFKTRISSVDCHTSGEPLREGVAEQQCQHLILDAGQGPELCIKVPKHEATSNEVWRL